MSEKTSSPRKLGLAVATAVIAGLVLLGPWLRDVARAARDTYGRVYDQWPESPFSEPARERMLYLERHFFDVR